MANHMAEVAKMLGVELGEKFKIIDPKDGERMGIAVIDDDGFLLIETNVNYTNSWQKYALENLLTGKYTIKGKPWKPKYREQYYSVGPGGVLEPSVWLGDLDDMALYKLGNCYKTAQEAEANRDKWVAFYASDEVLEV